MGELLRLKWTSRRPDGREYTIADGPVAWGDPPDGIAVSIEVPHLYGGTIRTGYLMTAGVTETLTLTLEPDPPEED